MPRVIAETTTQISPFNRNYHPQLFSTSRSPFNAFKRMLVTRLHGPPDDLKDLITTRLLVDENAEHLSCHLSFHPILLDDLPHLITLPSPMRARQVHSYMMPLKTAVTIVPPNRIRPSTTHLPRPPSHLPTMFPPCVSACVTPFPYQPICRLSSRTSRLYGCPICR